MKEMMVFVAVILAIVGNVPYLRDVITNKIQPHPYTWLVWSIVSAVTFFGQITKGGGIGSIPTGVAECFTIIIFLFSLRYGFRDIAKRDTYFLIAALLGLIPWAMTSDPTLSVVTVVSIDVIAFIPTLRKAWHRPKTETPILYAMNVLRHILTIFSLEAYNVATTLHSIAMIATNSLMTLFILLRRNKN
ncbi:MAG: hypothetical protein KBC95_00510 [Candidatus Peribacteraceae bacterium]|nr:hypothetical protein [Candidatus Peribacteraceae bacterium]